MERREAHLRAASPRSARRRRHRPDHPQAVPEADRAHRVRRVPVLRLGAGAGLEPAQEPDPGHRRELRLRLVAASTRRGRCRTTASRRSWRPRFADIFFSNCTKIGLLPVVLPEEDVQALMEAGEGGGRPRGLRGALRRSRGAVRARRGAPPPAAQRPRRHRPHAPEGRRHLRVRARARASRPRHAGPMPTIALLPGDGIGPEVAAAAVEVLDAVADDLAYDQHLAGGAAIDAHGTALTDEAMEACKASDAVLLGALGGPKWDTNESGAVRPEQGLFRLRAELGLYANLRPVRPLPGPLRRVAAQARADRGRRHADRARAHRRPVLRRARHRGRPRVRHDGLHRRGDRADRAHGVRGGEVAA